MPHTFQRLWGYLLPHRASVVGALGLSVLVALATSSYAYLLGPLLRSLLMQERTRVGPFVLTPGSLAWQVPLLLVSVATVKALGAFLQNGLMQGTAFRVMRRLRRELYEKLLAQPPSFYRDRHTGDLTSRLTLDVGVLEFAVSQALVSLFRDSLQILALLAVCIQLDGRLFLLMFLVAPATVFPLSRLTRSIKKVARATQATLGRLSEKMAEVWSNLPIVQAYNAEGRLLASFGQEQENYLKAIKRSLFIRGAISPLMEFMGLTGAALLIAYGAHAVAQEPLLAERLLTFLASALLLYRPLKTLSGTFSQLAQATAAADRVFDVLDAPVPVDEGLVAPPLRHALEFRDVDVSYEEGKEVLRHVRFTVPAGSKVGLLGSSGAGKTTVFSSLLGFVTPTSGEILWDKTPLHAFNLSSLRNQMAWVPQEPILFSGTIRQNLLWAQPSATEAQLWECLQRAHADTFVREKPEGLDAQVGERGALLSGGQRQRLAIARAFLKEPSVLLLDEPTSALDAHSESEVQAGLRALLANRTALVIAHRLSTTRDADLILVLEAGRVVESGTHETLLRQNGRYRALWEAQSTET